MDAFYEESAIDKNSAKGEKKYKITNVFFWICVVVSILMLFGCISNIPVGTPTDEESKIAFETLKFMAFFLGGQCIFFALAAFFLYKLKARFNVSYDYCFVSGELRISKVFNVNRRKLIARLDSENILQIGDVDNPSYERFRSDPSTKEIICTTNAETSDGKFFMYILAQNDGKKLYILECRETLLINIMKFARRGVLESDYVMQEKKQSRV